MSDVNWDWLKQLALIKQITKKINLKEEEEEEEGKITMQIYEQVF